jgi:phosphomannomutase
MAASSIPLTVNPIKFGTDGWRGLIAADFTVERLVRVAPLAARVLRDVYGQETSNHQVIVGHDRRFMSEQFAQVTAQAVQTAGFDVLLTSDYAPTPVFSWVAKHKQALGALVITASHNPGIYSGLKVKGAFGGSVPPDVTKQLEALLVDPVVAPALPSAPPPLPPTFNPWDSGFCEDLRSKVDLPCIQAAIQSGKLTVFADVMHGAAATGLERLLGLPIRELNSDRDPLFEGGAPEPLPRYIGKLLKTIQNYSRSPDELVVGLVFDGDGDRIAAVDGRGNFLSSQILIPILIEHLATRRGYSGEVVKTVSGSDLMPKVADLFNLPLFETPVGYKYIADRMLETQVLLGGEESGGIGYGHHIPERDALLSALYVLEAVAQSGQDLSDLYQSLQERTGFTSAYDRIDLALSGMEARSRLLEQLQSNPPQAIAGQAVVDCNTIDGYKFRLTDGRWLMIRFSGTEPVLRLYCEAPTLDLVHQTLTWAKDWAS